jgi:PPM family protein phosphatase
MRFSVGAATDVGRRAGNEDRFLVDEDRRLYAVADGMGGHRAGEVASATAIESLRDAYRAGRPLNEAVEEANSAVFAKASANVDMRGMGTTLTAVALVEDHTAVLGHVGDSRAYLMRDGGVTQVTEDHSLVEQLVREGRLSPEEAAHHPQRAIITRALGVDPEVKVDTDRIDLRPGDRLLLCSDGLTNMVDDNTIAGVLGRQHDAQRAADILVETAKRAGGDDNITVVVLDVLGDAATEGMAASAALGQPPADEPTGEWVTSEEEAPADPEAEAETVRAPKATSERRPGARPVLRVVAWILPVALVLGVGVAAVGWYARRTFYVGLKADRVALFRGVPGGLLGWDPTVEQRSHLRAEDLTPAQRADLEGGHRFANRPEAGRFLQRLEENRLIALAEEETTPATPPLEPGQQGPANPVPPVKPVTPSSPSTITSNR